LNKPRLGKTHETGYEEALERKVGKITLYREERYSGSVSCTVLKTSPGWKQFGLSLTFKRSGTLPVPEDIGLTPASDHDLSAFRQITPYIQNREVYADKAYIDSLERDRLNKNHSEIYTLVKQKNGTETGYIFEQLLSTSVSRVRQPIESLFN